MGLHMSPGKVSEWSKFQKFVFKSFFCKIFLMREKILWNPHFFLHCTKRKCSQIKPQIKVEIIEKSLVIINSSNEHINSYVKIILLSLNYSGQKNLVQIEGDN